MPGFSACPVRNGAVSRSVTRRMIIKAQLRDDAVSALKHSVAFARAELGALAALAVVALGLMVFVEVADDMSEADGRAFDQRVLMTLRPFAEEPHRAWGPWWLEEAAADITSLGGISVLSLFALLTVGFLLFQRKWLSSLLLVSGLAGGVALSEGTKAVFERERPPEIYQAVETINASFPSGHTLLATVFYLSIGVMLMRAFPHRRLKTYVLGCAILIALLVGVTRVYLGVHWVSDVFGGWSLGAAWAMALWLVDWAVKHVQRRRGGLQDEDEADQTSNTR